MVYTSILVKMKSECIYIPESPPTELSLPSDSISTEGMFVGGPRWGTSSLSSLLPGKMNPDTLPGGVWEANPLDNEVDAARWDELFALLFGDTTVEVKRRRKLKSELLILSIRNISHLLILHENLLFLGLFLFRINSTGKFCLCFNI